MNKTETNKPANAELVKAKCTMCVISEGKGLCRHPQIVPTEIECNGTPMDIEHCPMFSMSSAPADFMAQIDQHNKFQESLIRAAMPILKAQGLSEEQMQKVKQQVGMEEKRQEESISKLWDLGKTVWKDYVEPANKAREREETDIEKRNKILEEHVKRQEELQITFSVAIPFLKATGLSNKRIEIIKNLMNLEGDIGNELGLDDQKDLCDLYNMMCGNVDPKEHPVVMSAASCMGSILRIGLEKNYLQENIDKMCGVSKLIWKDHIESIKERAEVEKKIEALEKENDDLTKQLAAEKKRIAELKTIG